jgi:hypothetical protein
MNPIAGGGRRLGTRDAILPRSAAEARAAVRKNFAGRELYQRAQKRSLAVTAPGRRYAVQGTKCRCTACELEARDEGRLRET